MAAPAEALEHDDLRAWVDRTLELARALHGVEAFEVRADTRDSRQLVATNGAIRSTRINCVSGLGIRVFAGGGASYAYATEMSDGAVREMLARAVDLARANGRRRWRSFPPQLDRARRVHYEPKVKGAPDQASPEDVLSLVRRAEQGVKDVAKDASVQTSFGARTSRVVLADSAGSWVELGGLVSTLLVQSVGKDGARFGDAAEWRGGERGIGDYEDEGGPEALGREAGRLTLESMDAVAFPAGRYRTLTDTHLSGLLAHESFGHLTEYDLVSSGWSVLRDRLGETLASDCVSIQDAPIVEGPRKQGVVVPYDEEGTRGAAAPLLTRGVLAGYMHTRDSAADAGAVATGNGRALDARFPPIVRMRNTFFDPGEASVEEALEQLGDGVYLIGGRGGAPRSDGSFMFTSKRGYTVKNGKIDQPVRSMSIHGNVLDFLRSVELVTSDFQVHTNYFGGCGKWEQSFLHVGTGGPHVLVSGALVGGNAA